MEINKIYFGDAYDLIKELPNDSIDCIYTDIPYLYKMGGKGNSPLGNRMGVKKQELSEIQNGIDFSIFEHFVRVLKKGNLFIWCSKLQIKDILNYFIPVYGNYEILTWNKTNPSPTTNNTWLPDVEYCLYFRQKGTKLNDGYHLKSKWYTTSTNKNDKDLYIHPTIKPLELVKRHIEHATKEGDLILDPFMGSGTTAVAALETGRNYIGFEKNEEYYKISTNRLKGLTVKDVKNKEEGQTSIFDILEES